jgi:sterol desaturase/sphingolipid hydroxylase (fatty acid hydroxylase superfamily)
MTRKPTIGALVNSKLIAITQQLGLNYDVKDFAIGGRGGTYNLVGVFIVAFVVVACIGKLSMLAPAIVASSAIVALLLDRESISRKLDLAALPAQLVSYFHLMLLWLRDMGPGFILCFLCYSLIEPYFKKVCLWNANSFWALYGACAIIRTFFLIKYLLTIWMRWDDARPPFEIRRMNMRTREEAARHILWSFFMGNAGLAVRCGQQIAAITLFDGLQVLLGMENFRPGLSAAIVGPLIGLLTMYVCLSKSISMFYKLHRTMHENRTLYTAVHRIHHKAAYPTVLDSGTETPQEFILTESLGFFTYLYPDWLFVAAQMLALITHYTGHNTAITREGLLHFHVQHHRLFTRNFGLFADYPTDIDRAFGTFFAGRHDEKP